MGPVGVVHARLGGPMLIMVGEHGTASDLARVLDGLHMYDVNHPALFGMRLA